MVRSYTSHRQLFGNSVRLHRLSSCFACSIITIIWLLTRLSHSIWRPTGRLDHSVSTDPFMQHIFSFLLLQMWFLLTFCQSSYILNLVSCDSLILYTLLQL
ncbi:hypothetical protein DFJ43DRAFT_1048005 [Lentinula guzmanii]|uniref:Uncharacterized protein n=1 Tax=Lentinula guzmanii TaxID=2804957 RepID=A0AA38JL56_9AGAR|nr:hypothetical protein DFJ43DRAFT_1048005 [Lentinula guzmanii]